MKKAAKAPREDRLVTQVLNRPNGGLLVLCDDGTMWVNESPHQALTWAQVSGPAHHPRRHLKEDVRAALQEALDYDNEDGDSLYDVAVRILRKGGIRV